MCWCDVWLWCDITKEDGNLVIPILSNYIAGMFGEGKFGGEFGKSSVFAKLKNPN